MITHTQIPPPTHTIDHYKKKKKETHESHIKYPFHSHSNFPVYHHTTSPGSISTRLVYSPSIIHPCPLPAQKHCLKISIRLRLRCLSDRRPIHHLCVFTFLPVSIVLPSDCARKTQASSSLLPLHPSRSCVHLTGLERDRPAFAIPVICRKSFGDFPLRRLPHQVR